MTRESSAGLLVLHAVRIIGFADAAVLAHRFRLDPAETKESLYDAEAHGWVQHSAFAGTEGWSLTERGRAENERQLAAELADVGGAEEVRDVYREFLPLNALLVRACTDWQLRPVDGDRLAINDHSDVAWDAEVLHQLADIHRGLAPLVDRLGRILTRFAGYDTRFLTALSRAHEGERGWVDHTSVDSCHRVWLELHEDLIATLGLSRHNEPSPG